MLFLQEQLLSLPMQLRLLLLMLLLLSCNFSAPKFYNSPAAAVPADAQPYYSEFLAAAAAPVAADIAADPVHATPPAAMSPCLLHLLMLRIDVTIRRGELLDRTRRPRCYCYTCWCWCWCCRLHAVCIGCCWSRLFCNLIAPKFQHSHAAARSCCACGCTSLPLGVPCCGCCACRSRYRS